MDRISQEQRSWTMSQVRGKNTRPEMLVRRAAHALGLRFRLHRDDLPGTPDLVFPKHNVALFVHGCFWHRHSGCKRASMPKTRKIYWTAKFKRNAERDSRVVTQTKAIGWRPVIVWECETKDADKLARILRARVPLEQNITRRLRPRRRVLKRAPLPVPEPSPKP